MTALRAEFRRLVRYGVVGLGTNGAFYLGFLGLLWAGMAPVLASAVTYVCGVIFSYLLNRRWTFDSQAGHRRDLPRFLAAYGIGLIVTVISMSLLTQWIAPAWAQLVTVGIAALSIYASLRVLSFGR